MNTSEQINELAAALAKAQAKIQAAKKDSQNPAFKSKYADLASVWDACREALTSNGLSVVQLPTDTAEPGRVALVTTLLHSSGQWISGMVSTRIVKDDPQGVGSALTYLRRYALSAMVGVAPDDDDGNAASGQAGATPSRASYQAPPQTNGAAPAEPVRKTNAPSRAPTEPMMKAIHGIGRALGYNRSDLDAIADRFGANDVDSLSFDQARAMIDQLKTWQAEEQAPTQAPLTDEQAMDAALSAPARNGAAGIAGR